MPCPAVVFANHKGGIGKTTCTVITAELLARKNMKVLVIDTDSQGNTSEALCPADVNITELPSVELCMDDVSKTEYCVVESWHENICLIASNISMEQPYPSEPLMRSGAVPFIYRAPLDSLHKVVVKMKDFFDIILIDTAPSLGLTNQASIFASDILIMPCSTAKHAVYGLPDIVKLADIVKHMPKYVLITLVDKRTRMDKIGSNILMSKFDCIGEVPKISRIAENLYTKRFILNRIDSEKKLIIEELTDKIYKASLEAVKNGR